ncbi:glucose 1-dehydrogenase [Novosphingobium sp. PASSN1]|uniref:SDR family NAD(P)-dependent oxidoreductase n=1 Tax=Novosphingobium sp. PASSN1 TaxID=2015561 RepID=UPI000BC57636|nr:glucose 1-dehydrogenase [Novosphingobium sp. PASSN1]OYU34756.1 MAG: short-chain dehydrogenase [Novosphingobium sp. PASSN1]
MGRLEGKRALVTGAGSGIGRAICLRFAAEGARVIAADIKGQDETAALGQGQILPHACDVRDPDAVAAMTAFCRAEWGGLDILVNNAGIGRGGPRLHETSITDWDDVIAVNLRGVFIGLKFALPILMDSGGGAVINMASSASFKAVPCTGAYTPSKAAVAQITAMAALEYAGDNIRVNAVAPGPIATPIIETLPVDQRDGLISGVPLRRFGSVSDVASVVLFLASDEAAFVTGATYLVDGGLVAG